ncbi:hypothetical protein NDU88_002496 [Pleurodeles waltl]|uniref:Uncharacterized protein n=1 Tax=Pleurodeles waltl TaxID=8319 RepID=A0AAV7MVW0_PLEWA|nr:hypothetical protein NDU88_002496 [Pleurodeles waltl]
MGTLESVTLCRRDAERTEEGNTRLRVIGTLNVPVKVAMIACPRDMLDSVTLCHHDVERNEEGKVWPEEEGRTQKEDARKEREEEDRTRTKEDATKRNK